MMQTGSGPGTQPGPEAWMSVSPLCQGRLAAHTVSSQTSCAAEPQRTRAVCPLPPCPLLARRPQPGSGPRDKQPREIQVEPDGTSALSCVILASIAASQACLLFPSIKMKSYVVFLLLTAVACCYCITDGTQGCRTTELHSQAFLCF